MSLFVIKVKFSVIVGNSGMFEYTKTGCHLSLLTVSLEDVWEVEDRALQRKKIMII